VRRDVAAWWCNRVLEVRPDVVWMTTDEYLELRDALTLGIREFPVEDNGAVPCLMGRPVVLVDQFDTYQFTLEDERRRYLGPVFMPA
jgi:hypothetical protein